jgi:hypothetical protein
MRKIYSEQYDAWYDADANKWLETQCNDPSCGYCANRPDRPITLGNDDGQFSEEVTQTGNQ